MSLAASPLPPHLASSSPSSQATPKSTRVHQSPRASPQHSSPRSGSPRSTPVGAVEMDTLLRAHGGDARKALEAMIADRNSLLSQNTQLWKLIEKQRSQCASLAADNDRLRSDRERANTKLTSAGLEPVVAKRLPSSSSAMGLGVKASDASIRRHNSDREDKKAKPSLDVPSPSGSSSQGSPSAPSRPLLSEPITGSTPSQPAPSLLPSPLNVQDTKLRRESRMTFPPEVSSFMTLADSPRDPPIPTSSSATISPSSMYSSEAENSAIPPQSSRALAMTTETVQEEPEEEEAEDRPVTESAPPPTEPPQSQLLSLSTPPPRKESLSPVASTFDSASISRFSDDQRQSQEATPRQSDDRGSIQSEPTATPRSASMTSNLLAHTRLAIPTSSVFPNALGRDVLCFIISVSVRPPNSAPLTWNVAKLFSAFIDLDTKIKARSGKGRKEWKAMVAPLPEGRAWKDFAPSKIDQRKAALETYLQSLLVAPLNDKADLCDFLNTDRVQAKTNQARKEGYLTKKGKNFGGWRTRFFVLDGPVMEYFETRGGQQLGSIVITNAQIGRQNRPSESEGGDLRHAFLIIEQTKKGSLRHVLCAESDLERDNWIDVLVRHVEPESAPVPYMPPPPAPTTAPVNPQPSGLARRRSNSRKSSKDVIVTAAQPMSNLSAGDGSKFRGAPSPSLINSMESKRATQSQSQTSITSSSVPIQTQKSSSSGYATTQESQTPPPTHPLTMVTSPSSDISSIMTTNPEPTPRPTKRQSIMPNRSNQSHSAAYLTKVASEGLSLPPGMDKERDRKAKSGRFWPSFGKTPEKISRPVFGVPLPESIAVASKASLPAIVFRCIEWLEAKKAETEEGIYRLSGSSAVIKGLKDRFDNEGDVNLIQVDEHWDPHAIAGLLKSFLRELPTSLLTRDLHHRFLAVMDLIEPSARVNELSRLVSELPPHNYALLRALTAHLILIVRNANTNKMTLRNIGIVFSPTLGIPAGIFSELVSHFGAIFDDEPFDAEPDGETESRASAPIEDDEETEETVRRKRNSMLYQAGGADVMLGLGGRSLDPAQEDSASEAETDDVDYEDASAHSEDTHSLHHDNTTPRQQAYPSAAAVRRAKASAKAAERGLSVNPPYASNSGSDTSRSPSKTGGLPASPRPGSPTAGRP